MHNLIYKSNVTKTSSPDNFGEKCNHCKYIGLVYSYLLFTKIHGNKIDQEIYY